MLGGEVCMRACKVWAQASVFGHFSSRRYMWKPSGHIRQKPQCLGETKLVSYYWSVSAVNTHSAKCLRHTLTHTELSQPEWCQQLSSSTSWNDSSSDIWHAITWPCQQWLMGALHPGPDCFQECRQPGGQAGGPALPLHVNYLRVLNCMVEKLLLRRGQIH